MTAAFLPYQEVCIRGILYQVSAYLAEMIEVNAISIIICRRHRAVISYLARRPGDSRLLAARASQRPRRGEE